MENQYELFGGLPPHNKTETSRISAIDALQTGSTKRAKIYRFLREMGKFGATNEEMSIHLNMPIQTVCARNRELQLEGMVKDSRKRRLTKYAKHAIVWEIWG